VFVKKILKNFWEKNWGKIPPVNGVSGNYYGLTGKFPGMSNSEKKFLEKFLEKFWL
jgi:hypothetical protein